jgi:hypothetical protein
MIRRVATALAGTVVLAALAGCAYQESFGLPDLTPRGAAPGAQVYPSYGYGYGTGYPYGYAPGYGNVYAYGNPWYAMQGPDPYGYGYAYSPSPRYVVVPCADSDRDGRCDTRPPKQRQDRDPRGHDTDAPPAQPHRGDRGEVPRVRNGDGRVVTPSARRQAVPVPASVVQQPARVRPEPRRETPSEPAGQRGPRAGGGRAATTGNDVVSSSPTQEP